MTSLLIRNARVLALDDADHEWPRADVVIEGGDIAAIGPDAGAGWPRLFDRVIEAEGLLAMPGLINAHFHSPGNLMKGCLPGLPLELFMLYEVPPLAPEGDGERLAYVRTMLGALEMLRRGITAVHDDAYHVPVATRESIDAIMRAYEDAGIRATVAIDQPNVVEYEKYPFLADLLPEEERRAMDRAPRQSAEELLVLYGHLVDRWHGEGERPARRRRLLFRSAAGDPGLLRRAVRAVEAPRPAVQRPHPRDQAAARARRDEVRQVARALRPRPRPPRRADDGDPRDLDRPPGHRAPRRERLHRRPQSGLQPPAGQRRDAVSRAPVGRRADLPRQRRDEHRRHHEHVVRRQDRRPAPDARLARVSRLAGGPGDARRAHPRRGARACGGSAASASSPPASPPT